MKVNDKSGNVTFGWNCFTHKTITKRALKEIPSLKKYKNILNKYCQAPDFDDTRFIGDNHCFYKSAVSDYKNGKISAKTFYTEYIIKARTASLEGDKKTTAKYLGRALHFLQDMANPMHTNPKPQEPLARKIDHRTHFKFESITFLKQRLYTKNYQQKEPAFFKSLKKLFMGNVEFSTSGEQVSKENNASWNKLAQAGMNQAITSTKLFLQEMEHLLK